MIKSILDTHDEDIDMSVSKRKEKLVKRFIIEAEEQWRNEVENLRPRLEKLAESIWRIEDCVLGVNDEPSNQIKEME